MTEDLDDPRHIYNVRARRAVDQAERDMLRALDRELDPSPRRTPVGMVMRALQSLSEPVQDARGLAAGEREDG